MKVAIYDNAEQVAEHAANIICQVINDKPEYRYSGFRLNG